MRRRRSDRWRALGLLPPLAFLLGPFLWLLASSLKTEAEIATADPFAAPDRLMWVNYVDAWRIGSFGELILNSLANVAAVVVLMILVCAPAGYAFAKMRFRGSEALFYLLILGLTVPIQAIVIPLYQLLSGLGLLDSLAGITLAQVGNGIPFGVFLMRNFFRNVPHELLEAARVDGCGHGRILLRIFLPISAPAVLALVVISALGTWNDFFLPLVVLISPEVQTLPLGLVRFAGTYSTDHRLVFAGTVISFLPIVLLYIATQRRFTEGLTQGALKG
ncbi:MAG: carbohydrate ABC transporter permease [Inquilinus limosus]|uniref:Carbohydrate ABC transporter permease n=1 Tax=Inquilinus limosus TaxID=171674 RepID=A0A952KNG0_9PROT|nr:carbohydrate ABC transporter permease [Inquilinus limosus]